MIVESLAFDATLHMNAPEVPLPAVAIKQAIEIPEAILKPVVILDAGFVAKENLTPLRELGYSYLINITRGRHQ